ncbi:MAG: hypothetical protein OWU33_03840 [Firmicutes bacterium]|nr:hypothetical protein [Bacillota bacterium]
MTWYVRETTHFGGQKSVLTMGSTLAYRESVLDEAEQALEDLRTRLIQPRRGPKLTNAAGHVRGRRGDDAI